MTRQGRQTANNVHLNIPDAQHNHVGPISALKLGGIVLK